MRWKEKIEPIYRWGLTHQIARLTTSSYGGPIEIQGIVPVSTT